MWRFVSEVSWRRERILRSLVLCGIVAAIALAGRSAIADDYRLQIDVVPAFPTLSTPVRIDTRAWFANSGQSLVSATYTREEDQIDIDVIMQDLNGSPYIIRPVFTADGGSVDCGHLPLGTYNVAAEMWLIPWGSEIPEFFRAGSASFAVTPEPTTPLLIAGGILGVLAIGRRRKERQGAVVGCHLFFQRTSS